jgi:CDP-paratose 2-epimerase
MLDYARIHGLKTVVFRHSSIFGDRQFSTYDQGWIGWFVKEALVRARTGSPAPVHISGDGKQVRDVLFVSDAVECYLRALDAIDSAAGEAFNIGGGVANSISLLELFEILEEAMGTRIEIVRGDWRAADQKIFVADTRKAQAILHWTPEVGRIDGIAKMIEWTRANG